MSTLNVNVITPVSPGGSTDFTATQPPTYNGGKIGFGFSEISTVAGTTYTLTSADLGKTLRFTSSSAVTVTAPSGLPTWGVVTLRQAGTGLVSIAAGGGVTINTPSTLNSGGQHSTMTLQVVSSTVYDLSGRLA